MSGTKLTTSIGSNAEQNSVRKTRQAEEEEEEQQQQQQGRRKCARYLSSCGLGLGSRFRAKQGKSLDDAHDP